MKQRIVLILAAAALLVACAPKSSTPAEPDTLRTGDLIFIGIPADYDASGQGMAGAIAASTGSDTLRIIHVAIAEVDSLGQPWVIDATLAHGVDRHPLDTLYADFALREGRATYIVRRLDASAMDPDVAAALDPEAYVASAKAFCGLPYDVHFLPDNGALYCSELVRDSYRLPDGRYLFQEAPMNFKDSSGEFPPYWVWLFDWLGVPIPQGMPGTNPDAMLQESILQPVDITL